MTILVTTIVGTRFRGPSAVATVGALPRGIRVQLRREADNPFDPNAVAVYYGTQHLGYVPRLHNTELAPMFDREATNGGCWAEVTAEAIIDRGDVRFPPKLAVHLDGKP